MRYITVPEDIVVVNHLNPSGSERLSFSKFAFMIWLDDERAVNGGFIKQVRWADVVKKFEKAAHPCVIVLEDEDYGTLRSIVEKPARFLPGTALIQCIPFSQAVMDAATTEPVSKSNHAEASATPAS